MKAKENKAIVICITNLSYSKVYLQDILQEKTL